MSEVHQQPITGAEDQGDRTRPVEALAQFYAAFNGRDLALMAENWDTSPDSVMDNPLGGVSRGWDEIRGIYRRLFEGPNTVRVEFFDYSLIETRDSFVAIGRERGTLSTRSGATLELRIRTSRWFRLGAQGSWRQVHHHGSMDEPDLLRAYQAAIRG